MKALGVQQIPPGDWRLEIKFDGYRALAVVDDGKVELWSRNENSLTEDYPEVAQALAGLPCRSATLDGEIVALDEEGRPSFQRLQRRSNEADSGPLLYYLFDLLELNGERLIDAPIEERQKVLTKLLANPSDPLRQSTVFDSTPDELLAHARKLGLEGIVAKAAGSHYEIGRRSGAWLKCRLSRDQEFVIGGFSPPGGSRKYFGSILVGYYEGKRLIYAGKVGTGFDHKLLRSLHAKFTTLETADCPFDNLPLEHRSRWGQGMPRSEMARMHWVRPKLVAQIKFAEWTSEGLLRQPVFLGERTDKPAKEVVRETTS
ncbi:MAG: non-homologous end-joining DNA ligase [Opitutus sp.]|nr:non-homologous end-joining DNA ligase [Opitutus sp.]